mmetsp:Transcript_67394/g.132958  ORF Transcript_67394/g.132958 Transcript_67394/m.132958 type:complete len:200 (-) Transcript_67394:583-1182(-)
MRSSRSVTRTMLAPGAAAAKGADPVREKAGAKARKSEGRADIETDTVVGEAMMGRGKTRSGPPKKEWQMQLLTTTKRPNRLLGTRPVAGTVAGMATAGTVEATVGGSMVVGAARAAGLALPGINRTGIHRAGGRVGTGAPAKLVGSLPRMTGRKTAGVTKSGQRHRHTNRCQDGRRKMLHSMHSLPAFTMWRRRPRRRA